MNRRFVRKLHMHCQERLPWHRLPAHAEQFSEVESRSSRFARFLAWAGSPWHGSAVLLVLLAASLGAASAASFTEDFEKIPSGKVPESIQVLEGDFSIREIDGNHCLELAGDPIGGFGALVGPDAVQACDVTARIWAAPTGKRFPEFGIGANGVGGAKVILTPGVNAITIRLGENTIATAPFTWKASSWTRFRMQVWTHDGNWFVRGKAWNTGETEPTRWTIDAPLPKAATAGRASVWGSDYSEQPIRFDDISVKSVDGP